METGYYVKCVGLTPIAPQNFLTSAAEKENNGRVRRFFDDKKTSPDVSARAKVKYLRRSTSELVH